MLKKYLIIITILSLSGCLGADYHKKRVRDDKGERITVGKVQREIAIGMPSSRVIEILGSPNVVTTDEERREVWVYDKIATDATYSQSENGIGLLLIGATGQAGSQSKSQRTLTIVIKFDKEGRVRDFAYHTSRF